MIKRIALTAGALLASLAIAPLAAARPPGHDRAAEQGSLLISPTR